MLLQEQSNRFEFWRRSGAKEWWNKTLQHIFWGFRNVLQENDAFAKYWQHHGFRAAMMSINLMIEVCQPIQKVNLTLTMKTQQNTF
jgi:hypothetical protein